MNRFSGPRAGALMFALVGIAFAGPGGGGAGRSGGVARRSEAGETEAEFQLIHLPPSEGEQAVWAANFTFERGVSDRLSLGIEVETEAEDGEALEVDTIGLQAKWVSPAGAGLRFGIQPGLQFAPETGDVGSETLSFRANPCGTILISSPTPSLRQSPGTGNAVALSYGMRADVSLSGNWNAGLEAGGDLAGLEDAAGQAHWAGPVLTRKPGDEESVLPAVELSLFLPLTDDTPDIQFRLELDRAF